MPNLHERVMHPRTEVESKGLLNWTSTRWDSPIHLGEQIAVLLPPLLHQLPVSAPGKAAVADPSPWVPATHTEPWEGRGAALAVAGIWGANKWMEVLTLTLILSFSLPFKLKKSLGGKKIKGTFWWLQLETPRERLEMIFLRLRKYCK